MRWLIFLLLFSATCFLTNARADALVLDAQTSRLDFSRHLTFLRDPNGLLTLDDVAAEPLRKSFAGMGRDLNFGITTDVIWLRLEIQRQPSASTVWWFELAPAHIGEVTLYQVNPYNETNTRSASYAGAMRPLSTREFRTRHNTFRVVLEDSGPQVFYLKLRSNVHLNVRGYLWQPAFYANTAATENLLLGLYYGAFILIIFISLLRWKIRRNALDLWWLIYLAAEGFVIFRMNGLAARYFFPEQPWVNTVTGTMSLSVMVWAGSHFSRHMFVRSKEVYPQLFRAVKWIGNLALVLGITRLSGLEPVSSICFFLISASLCILNCIFACRFLQTGEASAKFYFLAIWFMTTCVVLVISRNFGLVPAYQAIDYLWQSNLIVHAGLVSFGIILAQHESKEERRRAEDWQISADKSSRSNSLQKRMVALVCHEFRNSLALLNISMHAVSRRKDLPVDVMERHRNIIRVHQQMRRTIENFLQEERIQDANIKIMFRRTDMHPLFSEVIHLAGLNGKHHTISTNFNELPHTLFLDDGVLRLALTNLLDNAVKYSPPASRVNVDSQYSEGHLRIAVSDNGIGMSPESLSHLFEPHFKADLQSEGIGIGLYMVRMMLHAYGGDMRVTSAIGKGTTLEFWIKADLTGETSNPQAAESKLGR